MPNPKHLLQVHSHEVQHCRRWNHVVDLFEDVELELLDVVDVELLVGDFLVDHLHLEGVDVLVLAGNEHAGNADDVEVADLARLRLVLEVAVHQAHGQEERLVVALEVRQHLNHPVDHAGAQGRRNLVAHQIVFC